MPKRRNTLKALKRIRKAGIKGAKAFIPTRAKKRRRRK